jgi:hypothetical protein
MGLLLSLIAEASWAQDLANPLGWTSFGIDGEIAYAPVRLDGYELFSIAAPLTEEGSDQGTVSTL